MNIDDKVGSINVAVYGTLKKGFGNHHILEGLPTVKGVTAPIFSMLDIGYFPAVVPGERSIDVEVYSVSSGVMARLDSLEGYPIMYTRKVIQVTLENSMLLSCWIYIWNSDEHVHPYITNTHNGALTWHRDQAARTHSKVPIGKGGLPVVVKQQPPSESASISAPPSCSIESTATKIGYYDPAIYKMDSESFRRVYI